MRYQLHTEAAGKHAIPGEAPLNLSDFESLIEQHFPVQVFMRTTSMTLLELREWLMDHVGFSVQSTWMDPQSFQVRSVSVDTDAKWCYYKDRQFRFKNTTDAVLFKLTHGGSAW